MKDIRQYLLSLILGFIPVILTAQIGFLNPNTNVLPSNMLALSVPVEETTPTRSIIESNENQMIVNYSFHGFAVASASVGEELYQYIHIHEFPKMGEVGKPALPVHNDLVLIPGGSVQIQILEAPYKEYTGFNIHPALEAASDEAGKPEPEFTKDNNCYSTDAFWPSSLITMESQQKVRNIDFAVIQIHPIQYNPVTKVIRVYDYITYKIIFSGSNLEMQSLKYKNSNGFLNSMREGILNGDLIPSKSEITAKSQGASEIILLTTPTYQAAADSLANWKRQLGHSVKVIAQSTWTSISVRDSVYNLYQSWNPHPDFLIILGDQADVPAQQVLYLTTSYYTDLYYVCMDGTGDYLADMARGRISVNSASQAMMVVQKIINYERNPVSDPTFYNTAMACGYFQDGLNYTSYQDGYADRRFLHTAEEIRSYMMTKNYTVSRSYYAFDNRNPTHYNNGYYSDGQAIPSDLLKSNGFVWNAGTSDITAKINAGAFVVYHRDHGYIGGYGWEHPYYLNQEATSLVNDGNNINQLTNGDKLPVVFSVNCHTGNFAQPECFAENFIRKSGGGAVGVFAPSYESFSGYNDALIVGMMDAIWSNPGLIADFGSGGTVNPTLNAHTDMLAMGDVLNQGLLRMVQTWAASAKWKMQNEIFHYFGDPSMKIWTSTPTTIAINSICTAIRLDSTIQIQSSNCLDASYTFMVDGALYSSGTLSNGMALIQFQLDSIHEAVLTIYKTNCRPIVRHINIDNRIKIEPPLNQASNIRFLAEGAKSSSITIEWDKGDGDFSLVKISYNGDFTTPVDGMEYPADNYYSAVGEQVVYSGAENIVTVFNLISGSVYWFRVYEYNNEGIYTLYQTTSEVDNPNASDGGGLLPVEVIVFKASVVGDNVIVEWVTASEVNNQKFLLEKSVNRYDFSTISEIKGFGNSNIPIAYEFVDNENVPGTNYYRLIQVDFDGNATATEPIAVEVSGNQKNQLIQNVTVNQNSINLICSNNDEIIQITIVDMSGRIIYLNEIDSGREDAEINIQIQNINSGLYMVSAKTPSEIDNRKLIIN